MHGVNICDLSGIEMLESTVATYERMGGQVFFVRPRAPVLSTMANVSSNETTASGRLRGSKNAAKTCIRRSIRSGEVQG